MALSAKDRVMRARIKLLTDSPFFGYLLVRFKYKELEDTDGQPGDPKTFAVTYKGDLLYYRSFVEKLTDEKWVTGILVHEVLHVALEHLFRTPRDARHDRRLARIWNYATDLVANATLLDSGFALPARIGDMEFLVPTRDVNDGRGWRYEFKEWGVKIDKLLGRTAEEIYHALLRALPPDLSGGPCGFDRHVEPDGDMDPDQLEEIGREWSGKVAEAAAVARGKGKLPGSLAGLLGKVDEAKVNWRAYLWQFVQSHTVSGYSYARPSRKAIALGVYLPMPYRENLELVVSVDSSGSISQQSLAEQVSEAQAIVRSMANVKATILVCDARVHEAFDLDKFNMDEWLAAKHTWGRGGTSHRPVVEWINANKPEARLYVCMTDGQSDIEACFGDLPHGMSTLILLAGAHVPESRLRPYASTIIVED